MSDPVTCFCVTLGCFLFIFAGLDLHFPQMRQLFKDPCSLENSEFIVVKTPESNKKEMKQAKGFQQRRFFHGTALKGNEKIKQLTIQPCTEECDLVFW